MSKLSTTKNTGASSEFKEMSSQMLAAHAKVQKAFKEQTDNVNKEEKELLLAVRLGPKAAILSAACLFLASISSIGHWVAIHPPFLFRRARWRRTSLNMGNKLRKS